MTLYVHTSIQNLQQAARSTGPCSTQLGRAGAVCACQPHLPWPFVWSFWPFEGFRSDFFERSGSIWGAKALHFRLFLRSDARLDEKRPTLTKHCPWRVRSRVGRSPGDPKSTENRCRNGCAPEGYQKRPPNAIWARFWLDLGSIGA